jgi:Lon protease-like protein
MPEILPLFPLNTVLFPRTSLPLRIFEERYKKMINACVDEARPFGVALIQEGDEVGGRAVPFELGCAAEIKKLTRFDNGEMKVVVEGTRRFRVVEELDREPYRRAEVRYLEDELGNPASAEEARALLRDSMTRYANLYCLITSKQLSWEKHFADPVRFSWYLADLIDVENPEKQDLLELPDAAGRLLREGELLRQENQRLELFWGEHKFPRN